MGSPMHFSTGYHADIGQLLIEYSGLRRTVLGIDHRSHVHLADGNKPV